jgi:transcriptional regulator with XRE-family HTH domain
VDDAPQTDDLDLAAVTGREVLLTLLQTVYLRADRPSLRALEARTRHGAVPLSKTVAAELLKGQRFPRKAVMLAFLQACGVQDDHLGPWQRAWERIAVLEAEAARRAQLTGPGAGPLSGSPPFMTAGAGQVSAEMRQLREENQELRQRLAASGPGTGSRQSYRDDQSRAGDAGSPAVSRRELGASLRALRLERGMTVEQVAGHLMCSAGKVSRMESGFRSGTVRDIRDLCILYDLPEGPQRDHLMELAHESKRQGWWEAYPHVIAGSYVGLEDGTASIRMYQCAVVPGLLQTEHYMRAIMQTHEAFSSYEIIGEEVVQVRLARQRMLTRPDPPGFWAIIDEAALRRLVGGTEVMRGQLEHLAEVSRLPNIRLQVIPFSAGAHTALGGSFTILEFTGQVPGVVYTESPFDMTRLEQASDLKRYQESFEDLRVSALGEEESHGRSKIIV